MKKISITLSAMLLIACIAKAQQPPPPPQGPRPSPEEHLKQVTTKLQKDLALNDEQKGKVEAAYKTFFEGMHKLRGNSPPPPPPLPPEKRAQADKLIAQRDESIKKTLSSQQFAKYKEIEKTMRPPRPPGPQPPAAPNN